MESWNHKILKEKAIQWLWTRKKCRHISTEVKIGKYIFDVIGSDGRCVYIIEAKQDINDFLRECNRIEDIKENIEKYKNELYINGDKELYRDKVKKERNKGIKFYDDSLLKLSSSRYIIAPDGMIKDVPENWGLINEEPRQLKECKNNKIDKSVVERVIRYIGKRNTKKYLESIDVIFNKQIEWPNRDIV